MNGKWPTFLGGTQEYLLVIKTPIYFKINEIYNDLDLIFEKISKNVDFRLGSDY